AGVPLRRSDPLPLARGRATHRGERPGDPRELPGRVPRLPRPYPGHLRRGGRGLRAGAHRRASGCGPPALPRPAPAEGGMTFAQPWLLLGAAAALIPLAVHLFDRRKPRPHPFAAIAFVLRSQRRTASRLKLKRIVLYTLRTLILLAIPLALARPELRRPGTAVVHADGPAVTALVVDRGLAMRFQEGESLFDKARSEARSALASLGMDDPVTVVPCGPVVVPPAAPGLDRSEARDTLDRMRPAWGAPDLGR